MHSATLNALKVKLDNLDSDLQFHSILGFKPGQEEQINAEIAEIKHSIEYLKLHASGELKGLVDNILKWGADKGIIGPDGKATVETQYGKLLEEVKETGDAIIAGDQAELMDGIGDVTVVCILLANLAGLDFLQCLNSAYDVIKNRTGKMVDGKFVKDK